MTIKEFFKEHDNLKLDLQHYPFIGGCWTILIYDTTKYSLEPIFKRTIVDEEIDKLNLDFETIIMTHVEEWWETRQKNKNVIDFEEIRRKRG